MELADRDARSQGKPRMSLLPYDALVRLAAHYTRGAEKYAARNWEKGMPYSEMVDSLMRHLAAWQQGEAYDVEGFHHLDAVAWNALGLLAYDCRPAIAKHYDDRPNTQAQQPEQLSDGLLLSDGVLLAGKGHTWSNIADRCTKCGLTGLQVENMASNNALVPECWSE